jgi:hypothetical protein
MTAADRGAYAIRVKIKTPPRGDRGGVSALGTRRALPMSCPPSESRQLAEQARNRDHYSSDHVAKRENSTRSVRSVGIRNARWRGTSLLVRDCLDKWRLRGVKRPPHKEATESSHKGAPAKRHGVLFMKTAGGVLSACQSSMTRAPLTQNAGAPKGFSG